MKNLAAILFLVLLVPCFSGQGEEGPGDPLTGVDWLYTLAVQKGEDHFSFSLMKDGWLDYGIWGEGKDYSEEEIKLSPEEFEKLRVEFETLFGRVEESIEEGSSGGPYSFAFERVGLEVNTLEFAGDQPEVLAFLKKLSGLAQTPLPFAVEGGGESGQVSAGI